MVWEQMRDLADHAADENRAFTEFEHGQWTPLKTELDSLDQHIETLIEVEKRKAGAVATFDRMASGPIERPDLPGASHSTRFAADERHWLPTYREYKEAETRAIGSPNAFVQAEQADVWFDRLRNASVVLKANPVIIPVEDTQLNVPRVSASGAAGMVTEGSALTAADPIFAQISLLPRKGTYFNIVSNDALDDSSPALIGVLETAFTSTWCGASSSAKVRVRLTRAAFVAA